jgi:serine/threonine-protein kinase RsbT
MRFGTSSRPISGAGVNGDALVIEEWNGQTLLAVIDGLGHGADAAVASLKARKYIQTNKGENVDEIMSGLHKHLLGTRGAVVGLVKIDRDSRKLTFCSIGNVEAYISSEPRIHPASMGGIVGANIKRITKFEYDYNILRAVIMYSDGISQNFSLSDYPCACEQPQTTADRILSEWGKETDDATVLIAIEEEANPGLEWVEVDASNDVRALTAAELARDLAKKLCFSEGDQSRTAIAVSELARNIVVHAQGNGKIIIKSVTDGGRPGIMIIAKDSGPGIADISKALEAGHSTKNGLGIGLGGAKRLMDDMRIETEVGQGTTVTAIKWRN